MSKTLLDYLPETVEKLEQQLEEDQARWGDTWKKRPIEGQEERIFARFRDYYDQWLHAGADIPWLKIMGEAHIAMTRISHPELKQNLSRRKTRHPEGRRYCECGPLRINPSIICRTCWKFIKRER